MDILEILQIPKQGLFCPDLITIKLKKNQEDQTMLFWFVWSQSIRVARCCQRLQTSPGGGPSVLSLCLMWFRREECCVPAVPQALSSTSGPASKQEPVRPTEAPGIDGKPCTSAIAPEVFCLIKKKLKSRPLGFTPGLQGHFATFLKFHLVCGDIFFAAYSRNQVS